MPRAQARHEEELVVSSIKLLWSGRDNPDRTLKRFKHWMLTGDPSTPTTPLIPSASRLPRPRRKYGPLYRNDSLHLVDI